ncbi:ankyrin repeat domain-containing protein [Helicobacter sp. 23-1045]
MDCNQILLDSASCGDLNKIKECLLQGANINAKTPFGRTALLNATENGHLEVVRFLVVNGADITSKDSCGMSALMEAAQWERYAIAQFLLEMAQRFTLQIMMAKLPCTLR